MQVNNNPTRRIYAYATHTSVPHTTFICICTIVQWQYIISKKHMRRSDVLWCTNKKNNTIFSCEFICEQLNHTRQIASDINLHVHIYSHGPLNLCAFLYKCHDLATQQYIENSICATFPRYARKAALIKRTFRACGSSLLYITLAAHKNIMLYTKDKQFLLFGVNITELMKHAKFHVAVSLCENMVFKAYLLTYNNYAVHIGQESLSLCMWPISYGTMLDMFLSVIDMDQIHYVRIIELVHVCFTGLYTISQQQNIINLLGVVFANESQSFLHNAPYINTMCTLPLIAPDCNLQREEEPIYELDKSLTESYTINPHDHALIMYLDPHTIPIFIYKSMLLIDILATLLEYIQFDTNALDVVKVQLVQDTQKPNPIIKFVFNTLCVPPLTHDEQTEGFPDGGYIDLQNGLTKAQTDFIVRRVHMVPTIDKWIKCIM